MINTEQNRKTMNNNIFVFGSNTEGRHGAGAAKFAKDNAGAIYGVPMGLQGNSYAIITKDLRIGERSILLEPIQSQVLLLAYFAYKRPELTFYVSRIGCGHAGFTETEIAPMFAYMLGIGLTNVRLCREFYDQLGLKDTNWLWDQSKNIIFR
jgi:hypothetical protein